MPHGSQLTQIVLRPGESIRGSGDDLSNYFYVLSHHPDWVSRNIIGDGKPLDGGDFQDFGGIPGVPSYIAMRVVAMGDTNAVCIAQATHEQVLQNCGCLQPGETLKYGHPFPSADTDTLEGLYIDDHIILQKVNRTEHKRVRRDFPVLRDEALICNSRQEYIKENLPRAVKKGFLKEPTFKAWGTEVDSKSGRVGTPVSKLRQIAMLTLCALDTPQLSKKAMQQLLGQYIHPFMHRRELMSVFHKSFSFVGASESKEPLRIPELVKEELLQAVLILPFAFSCIRWPISSRVSATDATPKAAGGAYTYTSPCHAESLYQLGEHRGEHTRLDWVTLDNEPTETTMKKAQPVLQEFLMSHKWSPSRSYTFRKSAHVNLQEMRALKSELKEEAIRDPQGRRLVNLVDSRVVLGAYAKGRSSSLHLNQIQRSCIPFSVGGRKHVTNVWVDTHNNPADHPSRMVKIPDPSPAPLWLRDRFKDLLPELIPSGLRHLCGKKDGAADLGTTYKKEAKQNFHKCDVCTAKVFPSPFVKNGKKKDRAHDEHVKDPQVSNYSRSFKEVFSGCGLLTRTFRNSRRWRILPSVEAYPKGKYSAAGDILHDEFFKSLCLAAKDTRKGKQHWHFGLPCSSFSIININMNGGTRTRIDPAGNGKLKREVVGNQLLKRTLILIRILGKVGHTWTLENPGTSYVFRMPSIVRLLKRKSVCSVKFDQCMYKLHIDGDPENTYTKKYTRIIGNLDVSSLHKQCDHTHAHREALGSTKTATGWKNRARLAGAYPPELCRAIEQVALMAHL